MKIELKPSTERRISVAVGILSFAAFIIQGLGTTWGFEKLGEQLSQTALLFSGGFSLYFLGVTSYKNSVDRKALNEKLNK